MGLINICLPYLLYSRKLSGSDLLLLAPSSIPLDAVVEEVGRFRDEVEGAREASSVSS